MMEEGLNDSSILEEHLAHLSVVLQSIRSIDSGLKEAFDGLFTGLKESTLAAPPNSVELVEMYRELKSSEEELDRLNKSCFRGGQEAQS
ncbi:hypothetical protein D1007_52794 [Hordeum vulgare]|nr:hypothetical protein D1007_52794 [Hordeum vulgare]